MLITVVRTLPGVQFMLLTTVRGLPGVRFMLLTAVRGLSEVRLMLLTVVRGLPEVRFALLTVVRTSPGLLRHIQFRIIAGYGAPAHIRIVFHGGVHLVDEVAVGVIVKVVHAGETVAVDWC